ncbi:YibE/F family protein [Xylanimonas oleitrophica]|uniref:YibE/F family protein n=1 Tax=Xylanimonas oleitrophica TaxID=2607479 RepID=A0A2W5WS92_9MICO|nr:YibE/F family protein [Xylanimonas oleitrophica]PZR54217.1 YibE/F family protein [Xylanimonas oleitrophica]
MPGRHTHARSRRALLPQISDQAPDQAHDKVLAPDRAHGHGHGHGHGRAAPVAPRVRWTLAAILLPALLATLWGMVALWPSAADVPDRVPVVAGGTRFADVTVTGPFDPETNSYPVRASDGSPSTMTSPGELMVIEPGDQVRALYVGDVPTEPDPYVFLDFRRQLPLALLAGAFVIAVVAVARWRGLASLGGLAFAFAVFVAFTAPALLAGRPALAVGLVTSSAVMFVVLYLAHGFSARTTTALLGTLVGLGLTAALGTWVAHAAHINGVTNESATWLPTVAPDVDLRGVALCGLILAGMGVLNDVTITQASAVWELRELAPHAPRRVLFARGMRIGRDHIASTVYTMAFAYVGAALVVILNLWLLDQPVVSALASGEIAEEVVRTLVGSIGLVLAIPATTAIAAAVVPSASRAPREPREHATEPVAGLSR